MPTWAYVIIAFFVLDILVVGWILYRRVRVQQFSPEQQQYIAAHWQQILQSVEADPRHALTDADKLLDYALQCKGFSGMLGEKVKCMVPQPEAGEEVTKDAARETLMRFREALCSLGAQI